MAGREVPAFDLHGMLVDPIAVSSELYDHLQPFPDTSPALRALATEGTSWRCYPTGPHHDQELP